MTAVARRRFALAGRTLAVALALVCTVASHARPAEVTAPDWLRQAAAATLTPAQSSAPAIVLLDERLVTVALDGSMTTRHVYAAKVNSREGRRAGSLGEVYLTDTGRVVSAKGWIIRASGAVQDIDKRGVVDLALTGNDVYNEARLRLVDAGDPEPGMIFGAEIISEGRSVFTQIEWRLQERWPVKLARRALTIPSDWRVASKTFNHAPIEPTLKGISRTWQVTDLPELDDEPAAPPETSRIPRVAVGFFPAPAMASMPAFTNWKDVSRWLALISDPQAALDPGLTAKARELTAQAGSEFERIRAIGAYVRRVQYISIQIGVGRGGGYRPRPAAQVFARNHGDCKDKANLMRAMLSAVGITSFIATAYLGDRDYVREEWPSPQQFNHAILAVVLAETAPAGAAVVDTASHGRLLFVDPTAEHTAVGSLPSGEEGSLVLVVAADGGPLVRLPDSVPGAHRLERIVEGSVTAAGAFAATVRERNSGDEASAERAAATGLPPADYQRRMERYVSAQIPSARVTEVAHHEDGDAFEVAMRVSAAGYAQLMQNRLLILKPPFGSTAVLPSLSGATRRQPVMLEACERAQVFRVEVPAGFAVDELPQAASVETPYGQYTLSARQEAGRVVVERRLTLQRATIPAADYAAVRAFVDQVRAADTSPIVFVRSGGSGRSLAVACIDTASPPPLV
jgi:transglutaminase-like putative cysteine protease